MPQLKTLIIDDNPSDRTLALRELKKLVPQLQYREVMDEASFRAALSENNFNLVVTDYQLLWTTGLDILDRVRQQRPDCPVIMFTGTGSEEIAVEAMKAGLDDYVIKTPRHYVRLAAAVRSAWQRSQQQQALEEFKESYYRLFERVPLGLYRLNSLGEVIDANSTLVKMFGYSQQQDLQGKSIDSYHLDGELYRRWLQQLQQNDASEEFEGQIESSNGKIIWVRHNAIGVKDAEDNVICYEGAIANITASKQAELERVELLDRERNARKEAERANRVKEEFLATLSHELRTPLNAIIGWMQLLQTGNLDRSQTEKALNVIDRNAKAQNQLVEDLLDVSRIVRGTMALELKPVNLTKIVMAALDTVSPGARAKNIQIITQLDAEKITVNGDKERLQQIFWNLLINAIKFTPANGTVTISSKISEDAVLLQVRDTGQGIAADVLPHVFERFRQAETKSSTRTKGGLGLGLSIVRHLVEIHGGEVMVDSEGLNRGATFTVKLPLVKL
ncbi:response regulator [Pleurocapsales cyanobacterium LEGE 10410]|nr:response regulator [Pleurocapsales cyanobacterium LEGE 10410]